MAEISNLNDIQNEYLNYGVYNRQAQQPNELIDNKYTFQIHKLPEISWATRTADHPGCHIDGIQVQTTQNPLNYPGHRLFHDVLNLEFIIDRDLNGYRSLILWMKLLTNEKTSRGRFDLQSGSIVPKDDFTSDASLMVLTNESVPNLIFWYRNAWPTSIGPLVFTNNKNSPETMSCTVGFEFDIFDIETSNTTGTEPT